MSDNEKHFCVMAVVPQAAGHTRAALLEQFKWDPGAEITVRFLDGDPSLRARVQAVAEQWVGEKMANLTLRFVESGPADVRIGFTQGDGSWSYLGTMCRQIAPTERTMNYGWLTPATDDDEVRRVVLHEFGHALGLIHEHQNPKKAIRWNRQAVIKDLSGPPNNWPLETIQHNIFDRYDPAKLDATPVDGTSIMMYMIPATWTTDGFSAGLNNTLSPTDVEFIRTAYPW